MTAFDSSAAAEPANKEDERKMEIDLEKDDSERSSECENDESEHNMEIPKDSFSMFYTAKCVPEHFLPVCIFLLQMTTLTLIGYNLLKEGGLSNRNPMNAPVGVPLTVTISQYIACFVSVFTSEDLVTGMLYIGSRVGPKGYSPLNNDELPPTSFKWKMSNIMRMFEGAAVIVVSFIFIVQSSTVIDLFLNFAGVTFVASLDDIIFKLADNGFLGRKARKLAKRISDCRAYDHSQGWMGKRRLTFRFIFFTAIAVALWVGLSFVVHDQYNRKFACRSVTVTVGDTKHPWSRHYSGTYTLSKTRSHEMRAVYVKDQGMKGVVYYSVTTKRWTVGELAEDGTIMLSAWTFMSEKTETFDIEQVTELSFWNGEIASSEVRCTDCSAEDGRNEETCSWNGFCGEDNTCTCNDGYFGSFCQHRGPCTEMIMNMFVAGSKSTSNTTPTNSHSKSFDLLYHENSNSTKPVMWLGFPVYIHKLTPSWYMAFDGGYWIIIEGQYTDTEDLLKHLGQSYRTTTNFDVIYISEHSSASSPEDLEFRARLTDSEGDGWDDDVNYPSSIGRLGEEEFHFNCADCSNSTINIDTTGRAGTFCLDSNGKARETGVCEELPSDHHGTVNRCKCDPGFMGPHCQIRPLEGKVKLQLDLGSGYCTACGGTNEWSFWGLDGIKTTCIPYPREPLSFIGTNGTFFRQLGLNLNRSHFSMLVSSDDAAGESNVCNATIAAKEIYAIRRNISEDRINLEFSIHLNKTSSFFGEIAEPEGFECKVTTNVHPSVCSSIGPLQHAWIQLDMQVTPIAHDPNSKTQMPTQNTNVIANAITISNSNLSSLSSLQSYYPDWIDGYCDNDPEKSKKIIGKNCYSTKDECCQNEFSWQLEECLSKST